jgi:hypothetical protein
VAPAEDGSIPQADPVPQPATFIVLEAERANRNVSITIHYDAIQELRACLTEGGNSASGILLGRDAEEAIVIEHAAPASSSQPVGLFRTQPAGWPAITEQDLERIRATLPLSATGALFLIVRTLAQRPWSASLFAVHPELPSGAQTPLLEFPFDEYLLRKGWLTDIAPPPVLQPHIVPKPRIARTSSIVAIAAGVALIGGGAVIYRSGWLPSRGAAADTAAVGEVPPASPLALNVTRNVDELTITWNRDSQVVRAALAGTLTIRNGPVSRLIRVTSEQLREGRIIYHPLSGVDSEFRLELAMPDGRTEAESLQVVGFDTVPSFTLPTPASLPAPARQVAERPDAPRSAARSLEPQKASVDPSPVKRVNPTLSRDVLNELRKAAGKVTVSVQVAIDVTGAVETAKIVSATGEPNSGGTNIRLASLNAARQWKFRPAMAGGKAVPADLTLVFDF